MAWNKMMIEAKRLWDLGFAVHWLHPNSKRPVESGWTTGPRKSWGELKSSYQPGFNMGVRLGSASPIGARGHLAVIDVDVKSPEKRHRVEAAKAAESLLRGADTPIVLSGRGNGSRHYYCLTPKPFKTFNPAASSELVKVHMPSKRPSKRELEELSEKEIAAGLRLSRAWEVSLYSEGRQVVLPPSIHPDSNKPYRWKEGRELRSPDDLSVFEFEMPEEAAAAATAYSVSADRPGDTRIDPAYSVSKEEPFEVIPVELAWLDLSDRIRNGIIEGTDVTDRSAFLLPAATALVSAGLDRNEVLSVLTDPKTFLGACAYEHAKTTNRTRAALWVWKYTLKKVMQERSAELAFSKAAKIEPIRKLSRAEASAQTEEIQEGRDWRDLLDKTAQGRYRSTLNNCKAVLMHATDIPGIVGRNEFAANDYYLVDVPWRSKKGDAVTDIDIIRIKFYCAETFDIEFSDNIINQALMDIADLNRYHPVRAWLRSLKWDGVPRIDTWLKDYAGAHGPDLYLREVSRKVLVAMVARVFQPGIKFDHMVILEGIQGRGKSTLLRKLAGDEWFSDATLNIGDKDAVLTMQSKWLVEMGELSSLGKAELEQVKVFVTQTTDRIRAPYGKRVEEFPRQSVFIGTTNLEEYLRDLTGNRRFWPVKVDHIDFNGVAAVRGQLFAEAVAYWELGEPLYFDNPEADVEAGFEQHRRSAGDEWVSIVADILTSPGFPVGEFEMRDVAKRMDQVGAHKMTHSDVQRITRCFKLLNCTSWRESTGNRRRLWKVANPGLSARPERPSDVQARLDENSPIVTEF